MTAPQISNEHLAILLREEGWRVWNVDTEKFEDGEPINTTSCCSRIGLIVGTLACRAWCVSCCKSTGPASHECSTGFQPLEFCRRGRSTRTHPKRKKGDFLSSFSKRARVSVKNTNKTNKINNIINTMT
jgi:hypothetical protein